MILMKFAILCPCHFIQPENVLSVTLERTLNDDDERYWPSFR